MSNDRQIPALCPKSANPYTYCPLVFMNEDEMIMSYLDGFAQDIKRLNNLPMTLSGDEAEKFDRWCGTITAYMNGRIHELVGMLKEKDTQ